MSVQSTSESDSQPTSIFPRFPYPGLRSFDVHEWPVFFGREKFVDRIVDLLDKKRVLLVHGDSGAGKSSLIRAGLLPILGEARWAAGDGWRTAIVRPGADPMAELSRGLAAVAPEPIDDLCLLQALSFGAESAKTVARLLRISSEKPVCLVIDQLEELFEFSRTHDILQAKRLTQFLAGVADRSVSGFWVVLTMRSEYLGRCASVPGLAELVSEHQYLLPRMTSQDLLRAIAEPAKLYNGQVTMGLATRLIDATEGDPDQLPLIQHALAFLTSQELTSLGQVSSQGEWKRWKIELNSQVDPRELLSRHADVVFAEACEAIRVPTEKAEQIGNALLRALIDVNSEGHAIRRPQRFGDLLETIGIDNVSLNKFIAPFRKVSHSMISPFGPQPLGNTERIDISHESLLRHWRRISHETDGLLNKEVDDGMRWRFLLSMARESQLRSILKDPLPPAFAKERSRWLSERSEGWAKRYGGGWEEVSSLVEKSVHKAKLSKRRNVFFIISIFAIIGLLIGLLFAYIGTRDINVRKEGELAAAQREYRAAEEARKELEEGHDELLAKHNLLEERNARLDKERAGLLHTVQDLQDRLNDASVEAGLAVSLAMAEIEKHISSGSPTRTRLSFFLADESQRAVARELKEALEGMLVLGDRLIIPSLGIPDIASNVNQLRCFRPEDCVEEGRLLLNELNALLDEPVLKLADFSSMVEDGPSVRPRHFEVWLAPGKLIIADTAQAIVPDENTQSALMDEPELAAPSVSLEDRIRSALRGVDGQSEVIIYPDNPQRFERARRALSVPEEKKSIAFIDATLLGSGQLGILFTDDTLYFRSSWTSSGERQGTIPYSVLAARTIERLRRDEVSLGEGQTFVTVGARVSAGELVSLLHGVQKHLQEYYATSVTP